jgi:hypothetical protein
VQHLQLLCSICRHSGMDSRLSWMLDDQALQRLLLA